MRPRSRSRCSRRLQQQPPLLDVKMCRRAVPCARALRGAVSSCSCSALSCLRCVAWEVPTACLSAVPPSAHAPSGAHGPQNQDLGGRPRGCQACHRSARACAACGQSCCARRHAASRAAPSRRTAVAGGGACVPCRDAQQPRAVSLARADASARRSTAEGRSDLPSGVAAPRWRRWVRARACRGARRWWGRAGRVDEEHARADQGA
jgi:hypothetical protein